MGSFGSTEGPLEGCNVFFSSHSSHPSVSMKFVGKSVVTRVEVSPSEEDSGREDKRVEDVWKEAMVQGPRMQSKLGGERTEPEEWLTGGMVGLKHCWRLSAGGSELENRRWRLESLQILLMTDSTVWLRLGGWGGWRTRLLEKLKKNRSDYWVLFVNNKITNNDDKKNGREIVRQVLEWRKGKLADDDKKQRQQVV